MYDAKNQIHERKCLIIADAETAPHFLEESTFTFFCLLYYCCRLFL